MKMAGSKAAALARENYHLNRARWFIRTNANLIL
jgi:hypothetical protein